jgi:hypothetical protein
MAGDLPGAVAHYQTAAGGTTSGPERDYLTLKAARLREVPLPARSRNH